VTQKIIRREIINKTEIESQALTDRERRISDVARSRGFLKSSGWILAAVHIYCNTTDGLCARGRK